MNKAQRNTLRAVAKDLPSDQRIPASDEPDSRSRRGVFLKWLRKTHGWIGLWGATLGLLFGVTGILQNHRAIMKISAAQTQESTVQLALPTPAPVDAQAMATWLRQELHADRDPVRVRSEPSKAVPWGDKNIKQPARWSTTFSSPGALLQAEYWVGNNYVTVKRNDSNLFATLNNLHKGNGVGIAWILLADTIAGSIILLSLTGVLLWALLNRRRMVGTGIGLVSIAVAIGFAVQTM